MSGSTRKLRRFLKTETGQGFRRECRESERLRAEREMQAAVVIANRDGALKAWIAEAVDYALFCKRHGLNPFGTANPSSDSTNPPSIREQVLARIGREEDGPRETGAVANE